MSNPDCTLCPLHLTAASVCVPGRQVGIWDGVMIVGQSPGAEEDRLGMPFVGPSGRLIKDALSVAGLENYFLTNIVRCTPGRDKVQHLHVKACTPYLDEEITRLKPSYILALGADAMIRLLGTGLGNITAAAGKEVWSEKYQCWIMPALHPAAILRNMGKHPSWQLDISRFGTLARGKLAAKPPVTAVLLDEWDQITRLVKFLEEVKTPFTFDFEATPIPWWDKDYRVLSVAFAISGECGVVIPLHHPESPISTFYVQKFFEIMRPLMTDPTRAKTAHNMMYDDLAWYRASGYLPYTTFDTMIGAQLLDENRPKGLKYLGRALLGWPDWDIDAKQEHPLPKLAEYNAYDAAATWLLREQFVGLIGESPQLMAYARRLVMPYVRALERMIARGIYVDRHELADRLWTVRRRIFEARTRVPVENPNSNPQIGEWLYVREGLPIYKTTAEGRASTDEETINRLAQRFPQAKAVLEVRKPTKNLGTYLRPAAHALRRSFDGRAHYDYTAAHVETGRLSSRFHTTPREPHIRSIYTAPPGWQFVQVDYAQIEPRLVAWAAAGKPSSWDELDPAQGRMLAAWREGRDIYKETAASILSKRPEEITTDGPHSERQIMGKVPTLALIYRIGPKGLREYAWSQYELEWTDAQAKHIHHTFYDLWPELAAWHAYEERMVRARGWTRTVLGRVRRLPDAMSEAWNISEEAVKSAINMPIQGLGSDITQTSLVMLDKVLDPETAFIVGDVHDALLFQIREDCLEPILQIIQYAMEQAPQALRDLGLHLPDGLIKAEVSIGPWSSKTPPEEFMARRLTPLPAA